MEYKIESHYITIHVIGNTDEIKDINKKPH